MNTMCWGAGCMMAAVVLVGGWGPAAWAANATKAELCEAAKVQAAGDNAQCLMQEHAKQLKGQTPNFAKCEDAFTPAFTRAERKAGPGVCPTEGDTAAIEALVDTCVADIARALTGKTTPPACTQFPATGQTTCWNGAGAQIPCAGTGHDGEIQAGATLSYTDNGDGTITDNNTRLMWAKKSNDGTIHDKDNTYTWANALSFFIGGLTAGGGFDGYTDWRLPNIRELRSIVNYENFGPAVSPAFNTGCAAACTVLTCSCTASAVYWSSTTYDLGPDFAWTVGFGFGNNDPSDKSFSACVLAVRRGL